MPPSPALRSPGEFIRAQRELMSLSIRQLAQMAKVSNPYLSQIERGVYTPSAQVLKGIADALEISAETLYQRAGLLDETVERPPHGVEESIRMDPRLTPESKQALIRVYRGLVGTREAVPEAQPARRSRPAKKPSRVASPSSRSKSPKR